MRHKRKTEKRAKMMNSLEIILDDEQLKERRCFRASNRWCEILEGCYVAEVGTGDSVKSETRAMTVRWREMIGQWGGGDAGV